ncbi:hypothetical protein KM043_016316 [Ampulex compressa]|nr:hypothetical protein KM043_016316 [Ampulex compressa]
MAYQASITRRGLRCHTRRRLTELPVKRKTSSDVPPQQGCTNDEEVASGVKAFLEASEIFRVLSGAGKRRRRPQSDVLRGQENNTHPKDRRRLLRSVATDVVMARKRSRPLVERRSWQASRRSYGVNFRYVSPLLPRGMEIDWNAPVLRVCAPRRVRDRLANDAGYIESPGRSRGARDDVSVVRLEDME